MQVKQNTRGMGILFRQVLLLTVAGLLILGSIGCDLNNSDDDPKTTGMVKEDFTTFEEDAGLASGTVLPVPTQEGTRYQISVPDKTWSPFDMWSRVYLVHQHTLQLFTIEDLLLDDHDRRYIALLTNSETPLSEEVTGTLVWSRAEGPSLNVPVYAEVTDDIRNTINEHLRSETNVADSVTISIKSLGMNGNGAVFWANVISTETLFEYDDQAPEKAGWIVQLDNEMNALIQLEVYAPTGYASSKLSPADMTGDGIADLVSIGLYAPDAPTYVYYFANDFKWHWVGDFDPIE